MGSICVTHVNPRAEPGRWPTSVSISVGASITELHRALARRAGELFREEKPRWVIVLVTTLILMRFPVGVCLICSVLFTVLEVLEVYGGFEKLPLLDSSPY